MIVYRAVGKSRKAQEERVVCFYLAAHKVSQNLPNVTNPFNLCSLRRQQSPFIPAGKNIATSALPTKLFCTKKAHQPSPQVCKGMAYNGNAAAFSVRGVVAIYRLWGRQQAGQVLSCLRLTNNQRRKKHSHQKLSLASDRRSTHQLLAAAGKEKDALKRSGVWWSSQIYPSK